MADLFNVKCHDDSQTTLLWDGRIIVGVLLTSDRHPSCISLIGERCCACQL